MSFIKLQLEGLRDLAADLCGSGKCELTGILSKNCGTFQSKINELLETKTYCLDVVYDDLRFILDNINKEVERIAQSGTDQEKIDNRTTLSLTILGRAFDEFVEKIIETKINISKLGDQIQPLPKGNENFSDIIGLDQEKEEIKTGFIYPFQYPLLFPDKVRGMCLYGTAGSGKSFAVAAMNNEISNCVVFAPKADALKSQYVGGTAKNLTSLFDAVSMYLDKNKSTTNFGIIFIDEIDNIVGARTANASGGGGGNDDAVNAMLQLTSGVQSDNRIVLVGATNRLASIDGAILRRLPLKIFFDFPRRRAREFAIRSMLKKRFSLPNVCGSDLKYTVEDEERDKHNVPVYITNIQTFGYTGKPVPTVKNGLFSSVNANQKIRTAPKRTNPYQQALSDEDIDILVDMCGPRLDSKKIMTQWTGEDAEFVDASQYTSNQPRFGIAIADINNWLNAAITKSRSRVFVQNAYFVQVSLPNLDIVYEPSTGQIINNPLSDGAVIVTYNFNNKRYTSNPLELTKKMKSLLSKSNPKDKPVSIDVFVQASAPENVFLAKPKTKCEKKIPTILVNDANYEFIDNQDTVNILQDPTKYDQITSFDICLQDFIIEMNNFKASTSEKDYLAMISKE